jgi:aspartyl-tRNA synthetase
MPEQTPLQQRYFELLSERVRNDRFPSHQLLDRMEASFSTPEQVTEYVEMLLDKTDESWYPSSQILDRIERVLTLVVSE